MATKRLRRVESRPIVGILLFTLGILLLVAFFDYHPKQNKWITTSAADPSANLVGNIGVTLTFWLNYFFGLAAWILPVFLFWTASLLTFKKAYLLTPGRYFAIALTLLSAAGLCNMVEMAASASPPLVDYSYYPNGAGGTLGSLLYARFLESNLGIFGGTLILSILFFAGTVLSFSRLESSRATFEALYYKVRHFLTNLRPIFSNGFRALVGKLSQLKGSFARIAPEYEDAEEKLVKQGPKKVSVKEAPLVPKPTLAKKKDEKPAKESGSGLKIFSSEPAQKSLILPPQRKGDFTFPSQDLLSPVSTSVGMTAEEHEEVVQNLVRVLAEFGVEVIPGEVHAGPVITRYEVTPAPGVRVEKIANLDKNIALALKAHSVRILAPVPGKGSVGIEIPNHNPATVSLREIIESTAWAESTAEIPIVLGKEVTGKPLVYDLTRMPHLLIAGSTGSGKTVCINTIIASLLYHASPDDLRFIMIDPKIVEMQLYNDLPHMLIPVVTEPKKVPGALKWLIKEMEHRYQVFAASNVRNIAGFNAKILKDKKEKERAKEMDAEMSPEERAALNSIEVPRFNKIEIPKEKLPYIVCIIDELADLMMVAPADIETCIARLAQLARAAGIHLILATQRPSVNVITGVIKANLPSRIAFKVASKVDSRTILDGGGADQLIGRGDMLFIPPGTSNLVRAQGAFLSDDEIFSIVEALKVNGPPHYADDVQKEIEQSGEEEDLFETGEWDDEMIPASIEVIRTSSRASTSLLQRRLKIGYNRAARIMDILEEQGIVGPENGQNPREILKEFDSV